MRIGISPSPYDSYYGHSEKALERIRAHGYECMDFQTFCHTEEPLFALDERAFEKELTATRERAASFGLTYSQTHGPWRWPPQDRTPEERAERCAYMLKSIRGTAYLGAKHFVIHCIMPFGCDSGEQPEVQWAMNVELFERLCTAGREYGVIVDLENLPFPRLPISRTNEVLDFVKAMNTPWLRMCLDTGHCSFYGDSPADSVRLIGKEYLGTLHVHDNDGPCDRHWEPGRGIIDWVDFSRALHEIDFEGVVSLETGVPSEVKDPVERDARERALAAMARRIADGF